MVVVASMECDWMWLFISIKRWSNWYPTKTACCPKWPNATWQLLHLLFLNTSMVEPPKTNLCTSFWSKEKDSLWRAERGLYTELAKWGWQPAESESEWHHKTIQKHPTVTGSFEKHPSWVEEVWCENVGFTKINAWMYTYTVCGASCVQCKVIVWVNLDHFGPTSIHLAQKSSTKVTDRLIWSNLISNVVY